MKLSNRRTGMLLQTWRTGHESQRYRHTGFVTELLFEVYQINYYRQHSAVLIDPHEMKWLKHILFTLCCYLWRVTFALFVSPNFCQFLLSVHGLLCSLSFEDVARLLIFIPCDWWRLKWWQRKTAFWKSLSDNPRLLSQFVDVAKALSFLANDTAIITAAVVALLILGFCWKAEQ